MKIKVNTKELQEIIKKLDYVRPNKTKDNKLIILEDIKVTANTDHTITFISTDLESILKIKATNFDIEEYGEGLLTNIKNIKKSFKFFKETYTTINFTNEEVELINGSKIIKNATNNLKDYPETIILNKQDNYLYDTQKLSNRLKKVLPAISKETTRPILTGVCFEETNLVGIDGYRIHMNKDNLLKVENPFVVAGKTLEIYQKLIGKKDCYDLYLSVDHEKKFISIGYENIELIGRLIEGEYFDYKQVIPNENKTSLTVNKIDLKENVDFLGSYSDVIKLDYGKETMNLQANNQEGIYKSDIETLSFSGETQETMGMDKKYLLEALKCIEDEKINLEIINRMSPLIIKSENELYLILPVRLKEVA